MTQAALPFMKPNGTIINVSSRLASISNVSSGKLDAVPCSYSYRIAKAAQNMLTQCMCREFRNSEMKICAVHPGRLKTDLTSFEGDRTAEEAAGLMYGLLDRIEHGVFYNLSGGTIEW